MSLAMDGELLRQRADYTYKFNTNTGRHGWLRLTPAYSLKIVEELVVHCASAKRVFDPFCGTGTTALCAAYHGHEGVTTDINPFLIWLATAKTANYSERDISAVHVALNRIVGMVKAESVEPASPPPLHNIERWWSDKALQFLQLLVAAIRFTTPDRSPERSLLFVAFCRALIKHSNAAFNHQSMSFKDDQQLSIDLGIDMCASFEEDVRFVLAGAAENPSGTGRVLFGDSRWPQKVVSGKFDLVITSPPYVNRMSYIRELRPYMYWLGFLENARDAGELDWTAIGGTWGIATSRLTDWKRATQPFHSERLTHATNRIAHNDNQNGALLANYVTKYFDDMWTHFCGLTEVLAAGAELHYIVGNSTFYGELVSTELLYAEMLQKLGFQGIECRPIRKRNSKKELVEFDVVGVWN